MGVATKHPEHPLDVFAPLAGHWTGTSEGVFGIATVERTCELVLGGRFFRVATRSVSEVEVHEDTGLFSFDRQAGTLMLREFHNEGYVITYRQVPSDGDVLTFESDHIENPDPTALKARISMRHAGDELRETLELASGGGDFRVCVNLRLTRR